MYLGVIADDFTGGTDIAGFLVENGLSVTQCIGVPEGEGAFAESDAVVISLKSRSNPAKEAVRDSLAALDWLRRQGCGQFFFKYCSTFDSTAKGNIGPVTDALLAALGAAYTVMAPALPVNGRTVYYGYLFVNGVPLDESGMRNHPLTPMRDANLMRLIEGQSKGKAANIPASVLDEGAAAVKAAFARSRDQGATYMVPDTLSVTHLLTLGEAVADMPLVTGGSGLGAGLAAAIAKKRGLSAVTSVEAGKPVGGRCVVLSGSASVMTNAQVAAYKGKAPFIGLDVRRCVEDGHAYAAAIAAEIAALPQGTYAPLVYATTGPEELKIIHSEFGAERSGRAVEDTFAALAALLQKQGVDHFIVAGGETSGAVVKALRIRAFHIGPQIAPGVPWVRAVDQPVSLALKSGNFGDETFFTKAQEFFL
ncbi:MAG: 3-oxo-tetronate kinase [Desulfovibrio sp.]